MQQLKCLAINSQRISEFIRSNNIYVVDGITEIYIILKISFRNNRTVLPIVYIFIKSKGI